MVEKAYFGPLAVHFIDGKPVLGQTEFDVVVDINVEWFSSLVMGVIDFEKLWMYGHAEVYDKSYVGKLDRLFHVAR